MSDDAKAMRERRSYYLWATGWSETSLGVWARQGDFPMSAEDAERKQLLCDETRIVHALQCGSEAFKNVVASAIGMRQIEALREILTEDGIDAKIQDLCNTDPDVQTMAKAVRDWARSL